MTRSGVEPGRALAEPVAPGVARLHGLRLPMRVRLHAGPLPPGRLRSLADALLLPAAKLPPRFMSCFLIGVTTPHQARDGIAGLCGRKRGRPSLAKQSAHQCQQEPHWLPPQTC